MSWNVGLRNQGKSRKIKVKPLEMAKRNGNFTVKPGTLQIGIAICHFDKTNLCHHCNA
jgi:hypothetical protein